MIITKINKIKNKFHNFTKKILVITLLFTNIFYYFTPMSFAKSNEEEEKYPALVPAIAEHIISKYVSTSNEVEFYPYEYENSMDKEKRLQAFKQYIEICKKRKSM